MSTFHADVAVVGASLAGCTAARLFAQEGLTVALLERQSDRAAYKRLCGHFIQPSAVGVLDRLGLAQRIEAAGGVKAHIDIWTRWGAIPNRIDGEACRHGYAIRRARLDPMLREFAIGTPGVTYFGGYTASALLAEGGVAARSAAGEIRVGARLVVGADGRNSTVAALAGAATRTSANARFCYMAYAADVDLGLAPDVSARLWALDRGVAIASRNEEGITVLALFLDKALLADFKRDRDAAFREAWRTLPSAPRINGGLVSKLVGYVDYPVQSRPDVPRAGVALVGDAAHSADPMWAIGCGWAFQTGAWLVDATAPALRAKSALGRPLRAYARMRRKHIGGHLRFLALSAGSTKANPLQSLMLSAAARDRATALLLHAFAGRSIPVRRFLSPRTLARAAVVNARHWLRRRRHGSAGFGR